MIPSMNYLPLGVICIVLLRLLGNLIGIVHFPGLVAGSGLDHHSHITHLHPDLRHLQTHRHARNADTGLEN